MSLFYENKKWNMVTLASVAISLTVGLVTMVHGTACCPILGSIDDLERDAMLNDITNGRFNEMKTIITYCYDHLNNPTNQVQDLVVNGTVASHWMGKDCLTVKQEYEDFLAKWD